MNSKLQQFLTANMGTNLGRTRVAAAYTQPLRERRDYASVSRKAFLVDQLEIGRIPYYNKDADVTAYYIADGGETILSDQRSLRILCPTFKIAANPLIDVSEVKAQNWNQVERALDKAKAEVGAAEDAAGFQTLIATGEDASSPNQPISVVGKITWDVLADATANISQNDIPVQSIFCNGRDLADFMKFGIQTMGNSNQEGLFNTGLNNQQPMGLNLISSRVVPVGTVIVTGGQEFVGRLPVRIELTVVSADEPKLTSIGFVVFEEVGFLAFNPKALQLMKVTR